MNHKIYQQLLKILPMDCIKCEEPLKNHTTLRIGGPADFLVMPQTEGDIQKVVLLCKQEDIPFYVLGNGSNLLVGDKGFSGLVLKIGKNYSEMIIDNYEKTKDTLKISAKSGIMLTRFAKEVSKRGFSGFEFATGIPGTLGGAVTMNAGAYGGEIKDNIISAKVMDQKGNLFILSRDELRLDYRFSSIQANNYIVLESSFLFHKGNQKEIDDKINELTKQRTSKQPLDVPSAGSTFKRPKNHFAGKLIMDSGLRGYRVGDIQISEKHCGFVVNVGEGKSVDVIKLIEDVDRIVYNNYGVHLEPEIKIIGEH